MLHFFVFSFELYYDARIHVHLVYKLNALNLELNPICYLLPLLAHRFLHVSRIRVNSLTLRLLISYIYIYIYDIRSLRVNMVHQLILYLWISFPELHLLLLQVRIFVRDIILTVELAQHYS
jgi:hypothetical protein